MSATNGRLSGKVAFITGTAGGQGRAAALRFASEGARIVGCDACSDEAAETVGLVRAAGGEMVSFAPVDLGDRQAARAWVEAGLAAVGAIDVLYNNAGAVRFGPVVDVAPDDWSFTLRNELDLVFWTTQAAWPHLMERGGGSIINTASVSALRGHAGVGAAAHAATKGGLIALSRQLAAEGCAHRIRVNSICPGSIVTPALLAARDAGVLPESQALPLGRIGHPEDIAHCALYLASDEANWVTGTNFVVDGGATNVDGVDAIPFLTGAPPATESPRRATRA